MTFIKAGLKIKLFKLDHRGFTLVELVIIIVTLGILATVAIPKFTDLTESSKITATKQEMQNIKRAITGNAEVVSGGTLVDRGFEGDVGFVPERLQDLVVKPDSIATYNKLTGLGWNGPYIENNNDFLTDSWDKLYDYSPSSRQLVSSGGIDSIMVAF